MSALAGVRDALLRGHRPGPAPVRLLRRLWGRPPEAVRGLYLWGGVGRGKTWLMDLFYASLPFPERRRQHFHRFMGSVHEALKQHRDRSDPLDHVAAGIADRTRVLCFDEFFVSDIADAMILGRLFHGLFARGVTLVATSNVPPRDLYRDGLQRVRFLPAIDAIEANTRVLHVAGGADYRLRHLEQAEIYHAPLDDAAEENLARAFEAMATEPVDGPPGLEILGRRIPTRRLAEGIVWFDFDALCGGPRSTADYVEIARCFHTVLVSGLPVLGPEAEDEARRFIALVDELYDHDVKLMISAEAPPEAIYRGRRLGFEFRRTLSRLQEMQSKDYLSREHRP